MLWVIVSPDIFRIITKNRKPPKQFMGLSSCKGSTWNRYALARVLAWAHPAWFRQALSLVWGPIEEWIALFVEFFSRHKKKKSLCHLFPKSYGRERKFEGKGFTGVSKHKTKFPQLLPKQREQSSLEMTYRLEPNQLWITGAEHQPLETESTRHPLMWLPMAASNLLPQK